MKTKLGILIVAAIISLWWLGSHTWIAFAKPRFQQEIHQSFPLTTNGLVRLDNVNGSIHIMGWDRPEIEINATEHANRESDLRELKIEIAPKPDEIRIHTKYPNAKWSLWKRGSSARVDYEIKAPRQAHLEKIDNVNGRIECEGVSGPVHASTVNGVLRFRDLERDASLESVNGVVDAAFNSLVDVNNASLKTVNGRVEVAFPANADVEVSANTLNGSIHSAPGLGVRKHWPVGTDLKGTLGKGGARLHAETVNGAIRIRETEAAAAVKPAGSQPPKAEAEEK